MDMMMIGDVYRNSKKLMNNVRISHISHKKKKQGRNQHTKKHDIVYLRLTTIYIFLGRRKNTIEEGEEEDDLRRTISYHHRKIYRLKNREQRVQGHSLNHQKVLDRIVGDYSYGLFFYLYL